MRVLSLLLALAAPAAAAVPLVSTVPFSVGGAGLSEAEAGDLLSAPGGPFVIVGDRLVKIRPLGDDGPDEAVPLEEGTRLVRSRVAARLDALRAAAREGRATGADKAEARALAALRSSLMSLEDRWFLRSLSPELGDEEFAKPPSPEGVPVPGPAAPADPLAASLRARLVLDDGGDPFAREALDMAVRRLLESPTARELAAEFVRRGLTVRVSFAAMENSVLVERGGRRSLSGYGGTASHGPAGAWVKLNRDYLRVDTAYQLLDLPATLGHELLGHSLGAARAEAAGLESAWNRWRGDELNAGVVGWLVAAELGEVPRDAHLWRWLEDPERYHREMHLAGGYYAKTFSAEEAAAPARALQERLARVEAALELFDARAADAARDWDKIIDHFKFEHGVDSRRLALVRSELKNAASPEERAVERERLLAVRRELLAASAALESPEEKASFAETAKRLADPFFAEESARTRALGERLKAAVVRAPKPRPRDAEDLDAAQIAEMYRKDLVENPDHWPLAR
ncbi:MAG: hypothetical protein HYV14_00130 [Elusimicrobia bacterium]|nr:hypothetical protein [Elusimicrobiota bacterium]